MLRKRFFRNFRKKRTYGDFDENVQKFAGRLRVKTIGWFLTPLKSSASLGVTLPYVNRKKGVTLEITSLALSKRKNFESEILCLLNAMKPFTSDRESTVNETNKIHALNQCPN